MACRSMADLSSAKQKIPIHGSQHPTAQSRLEGEDSRYTEDVGYGAVPQDSKGRSLLGSRIKWCRAESFLVQPDSNPIEATFELNDTLYAKALVPPTEEVYLWLGANVMLSYPIAEAETLLESKLAAAQENLANCEEDLDFLREQITVKDGMVCVCVQAC